MRCIEILDILLAVNVIRRLTLTWDVLKYGIMRVVSATKSWLTLTWDVLKYN